METDTLPLLDHIRLMAAYEQLKKSAYLTELACESISQASDAHFERWERIRDLVFALRVERDALRDLCSGG